MLEFLMLVSSGHERKAFGSFNISSPNTLISAQGPLEAQKNLGNVFPNAPIGCLDWFQIHGPKLIMSVHPVVPTQSIAIIDSVHVDSSPSNYLPLCNMQTCQVVILRLVWRNGIELGNMMKKCKIK